MLGILLQSKTVRVTLWTAALMAGVYDVVLCQHWWRVGLYILGTAVCATIVHHQRAVVDTAAVANYLKGRDHRNIEQSAKVVSIGHRL